MPERPPGWDDLGAPDRLALTPFTDVRWFEELDSTNRWLLDAAREGAAEGLVVVADVQTEGRGRRGRHWVTTPGTSLLCSVLFRPADAAASTRAGIAVGLAAIDAVATAAGPRLGLKWPNDLVARDGHLADRKVAGVLGEALLHGDTADAVVVGVGVNVAKRSVPPNLVDQATSVEAVAGHPVDRVAILVELLAALDHWWRAPGPELHAAHRDRCVTLGRTVRVERPHDVVVGEAVDVLDDGRLRVLVDGAPVDVAAGDVVHLRPA